MPLKGIIGYQVPLKGYGVISHYIYLYMHIHMTDVLMTPTCGRECKIPLI